MEFVKYLKEQRPVKRLAIFGDGASYHNSQEFRELLKLINQEKPEEKWWINCLKFAPNAPEKNPVEDIWLQTKNFMIAFDHLCTLKSSGIFATNKIGLLYSQLLDFGNFLN